MMEQLINKSQNWRVAVDIKIYHVVLIILCLILISLNDIYAQATCDDYYESLDESVIRLFTSERGQTTRENAFPIDFHEPLQRQEIRRMNFPEEQEVCIAVLESIHSDDPISGVSTHRALYKVKDHYFLVVYKFYTDEQGNQLIEEPTVGGLHDPEFNLVGLVGM